MSDVRVPTHATLFFALEKVRRRLWLRQSFDHLVFAACVLLFSLVVGLLLRAALGTSATMVVAVAALGVALRVGARAWRAPELSDAASLADSRARLDDQLTTAYWFSQRRESNVWIEAQHQRALRTAHDLDPQQVVPAQRPRYLPAAIALTVATAAALWIPPRAGDALLLPTDANRMAGAFSPPRSYSENETALATALQTLQDPAASDADKRRALERGAQAIDRANLQAVSAREALQELAALTRTEPEFGHAAQVMQESRPEEALAQLKKLAQDVEQLAARKADEVDVNAQDAKVGLAPKTAEPTASEAARDVKRIAARVNQETLDRVIKSLEQITDQVDAQTRVNATKRKLESFLVATTQRSALWANQFGQSAKAPPNMNAQPSPDTGNATLKGGIMFRMGAVAKGDKDEQTSEGSKAGSSSGHSQALAVEGAATQRLGVKLKREAIQSHNLDDQDKGAANQDWFYAASREESSKVAFAQVDARNGLVRENAVGGEGIPMKYRGLVKQYFTVVHEEKPQQP